MSDPDGVITPIVVSRMLHVTGRFTTVPSARRAVAENVYVSPTFVRELPLITTVATGSTTVIVALPLFPSLVAVIAAVPGPTPVTRPDPSTEATVAAELAHVVERPVSVLPAASLSSADAVAVVPGESVVVDNVTVTEATGNMTVIIARPLFPSLVAVIAAVPGPTPVTRPDPSTEAMVAAELAHVVERPVSVLPAASLSTAEAVAVVPGVSVVVDNVTVTEATGSTTVIVATPLFPSLVAVIDAVPGPTPVTRPDPSTEAMVAAELAHVVERPVSVLPAASLSSAEAVAVVPGVSVVVDNVRVTEATGAVGGAVVPLSPPPPHPAANNMPVNSTIIRFMRTPLPGSLNG